MAPSTRDWLIYHGSAAGFTFGTPATANALLESNQPDARFGVGVGSAGRVDADVYSDVIVGAHTYDDPEVDEGAAFVFRGGAAGVATGTPATAHARLESNQPGALFGFSAKSAGDVNGDGYSDVIEGALVYDYQPSNADMGAAFIFTGSATGLGDGSAPDRALGGQVDLNGPTGGAESAAFSSSPGLVYRVSGDGAPVPLVVRPPKMWTARR